jgi:hypothetical protein
MELWLKRKKKKRKRRKLRRITTSVICSSVIKTILMMNGQAKISFKPLVIKPQAPIQIFNRAWALGREII